MAGSIDSKACAAPAASEGATRGKEGLRLPVCLVIMDGFGLDTPGPGNAISLADTPVLDGLFAYRPWVRLEASGEAVGLPAGQMGNSEVGHLNIGAGRVVHQELSRINHACEDGSIAANPRIVAAFEEARRPGAVLHLMGLLSDGGVHSSNAHLYALIDAAAAAGVARIMVHCFMDGRDVPPSSGAGYVRELSDEIVRIRARHPEVAADVSIASISGRYYAMDRDKRWDRVERAYETLVNAANLVKGVSEPAEVMERSYAEGVTDEFAVPTALSDRGMRDGDAVIFFNFRPDRAREITRALVDEDFDGFERSRWPKVHFTCLTEYDPSIDAPVAFPKEFPENVLADVLADAGLRQYHIAETEKYAHVTFFLNGGREEEKAGEERTLIASPKVATYDLQPEMSEPAVADALAAAIDADEADVYIVNFANCDMVGHTGVIPAAKAAVEAVDAGVGKVLAAVARKRGVAFVTADHGNADKMVAADGTPHTAHTTALVPFVLVDESGAGLGLANACAEQAAREAGADEADTCIAGASGAAGVAQGRLADIAPTLLAAMGLTPPEEMTGTSLLA